MLGNIFSSLTKYGDKWAITESRNFTQEEIDSIDRNVIVSSEFGNSVCFYLKSGGMSFIPMSTNSTKGIGESINLATAKLLTLSRTGDNDIYRVED